MLDLQESRRFLSALNGKSMPFVREHFQRKSKTNDYCDSVNHLGHRQNYSIAAHRQREDAALWRALSARRPTA